MESGGRGRGVGGESGKRERRRKESGKRDQVDGNEGRKRRMEWKTENERKCIKGVTGKRGKWWINEGCERKKKGIEGEKDRQR